MIDIVSQTEKSFPFLEDVTNGAKVVLPQLGWKKMDETFW
ncbi:Uncharacterised protein [Escherichia coli]|nr:Uncharacterised protein [Escherichia coli]